MLDETALRRPDFRPGISARMADGQVWYLPAGPDRDPEGAAEGPAAAADDGGLGRDYEATVAAVLDAEDGAERLRAELALAIVLLAHNYDLGPADYQELLGSESSGAVLASLQRAFHTVAGEHAWHFRPRPPAGPRRRHRILACLGHFRAWGPRPTDLASRRPEVSGMRWSGPAR